MVGLTPNQDYQFGDEVFEISQSSKRWVRASVKVYDSTGKYIFLKLFKAGDDGKFVRHQYVTLSAEEFEELIKRADDIRGLPPTPFNSPDSSTFTTPVNTRKPDVGITPQKRRLTMAADNILPKRQILAELGNRENAMVFPPQCYNRSMGMPAAEKENKKPAMEAIWEEYGDDSQTGDNEWQYSEESQMIN